MLVADTFENLCCVLAPILGKCYRMPSNVVLANVYEKIDYAVLAFVGASLNLLL